MKRFTEWLLDLNESVTFQVADIKDSQRSEDLHSLCWKLSSKVMHMFREEFAAISNVDFYDLITPDGSYYGDGKEEINFYAGYFPEDSRLKILEAIKYLLPEFGIKLNGQIRQDKSAMRNVLVYRIPVVTIPNKDPAPELNVANANAVEILKMLNINDGDLCGSISVSDLNMKLGMLTDFHKGMALRAAERGSNYVSFGISSGQLDRYIEVLEKMVRWALDNHYDTISYC
jgi:hypothetical protein